LKIDRPFVNRAGSEVANTAVAAAMIQMAASLGLKSVAEIVETPTAARDLKRMGCDYAQGYFYCQPVGAEEALRVLRSSDGTLATLQPSGVAAAASTQGDETPAAASDTTLDLSDQTLMLPADKVAERMGQDE
jgi:hypothetical protein